VALDQGQMTRLSRIFDSYKAEVAAIPSLQREYDRLQAEEAKAKDLLMASLQELGYQGGDETPEAFLERVSESVTATLTALEALVAPASPGIGTTVAPSFQAPKASQALGALFPSFGMAPPPGKR